MATFTFSRGNAEGLRRIPLYLLGSCLTVFIPRTHRTWVFGSGIGPGEGALALLRVARGRLDPRVRLIWLATTQRELEIARELGLDAVLKLGLRGFWLTARARVLVVTHGQGDVNRYAARGGFLVQLWHGIPLKRLHLDSPAALESSLLGSRRFGRFVIRLGLRSVGRQISLFPVSSARIAPRVITAFGVKPDHVVVLGDPRDDILLQDDPQRRRARAREQLGAALGAISDTARIVLYAPTWREGDPDPAAPNATEWAAIAGWLDRADAILVVRTHPLGHGDYAGGPAASDRVRLLDAATVADLTPLLPGVDHLVTDYSSVAYDFALTGGTTVFLAVDVKTYFRSRGMYEPYRSFSGGHDVTSWAEVVTRLDALVAGDPLVLAECEAHRRLTVEEYFDLPDGRASERVLDCILARTTGHGEPPAEEPVGQVVVTGVELTSECFRIEVGSNASNVAARLDGAREIVRGTPGAGAGEASTITFPLTASRWGAPTLPLPSGEYRVLLGGEDGLATAPALAVGDLPAGVLTPSFRATPLVTDGELLLRVEPPLSDAERRRSTQFLFRCRSMLSRPATENAVWFETFYGQSTGDNPGALDRLIAQERPDITRYWAVTDLSVPVPEGGVPVVEFSREWWLSRRRAKLLVVNDWLRWAHRRQHGQKVLQTWHGTMLKRLALDRPNLTPRQRLAVRRQAYWWDAMLAQNEYSAANFRTSYGFRGPIWLTGYPRNDTLRDDQHRMRARGLLGLDEAERVVLYVPTWRDDRDHLVDHLDLAAFARALPEGTTLLVRGHSRTLGYGRDLRGERLIDVTSYPDVADLLSVADVLITDYSSVMFDFAATGKPMVFFTPDLDHYVDVLRGFYFDLLAVAPGPVVQTREDLLAAVASAEDDRQTYAVRYRAWQREFVRHDDGQAGRRTLQRILDLHWLS